MSADAQAMHWTLPLFLGHLPPLGRRNSWGEDFNAKNSLAIKANCREVDTSLGPTIYGSA
jgi:hypothetical protein